jgi:hypothetical protein
MSKRTAVLNSFRLEQTGNRLEIVDADGSRYGGSISMTPIAIASTAAGLDSPTAARREASEKFKAGAVAPEKAGTELGPTYWFRVTGTNRTLKRLVVFDGTLTGVAGQHAATLAGTPLPASAPIGSAIGGAGGGGGGGGAGAFGGISVTNFNSVLRLPISQAHIHGQAVIGKNKPVTVEAAGK